MAFARRKNAGSDLANEASTRVVNKDVHTALTKAAKSSWSGSVEIVDRAHGCTAHVYFHDGGVYSVQADGFRANIAARLVTAGVITPAQADHARTVESPATWLVENGLVDVDSVGALHQEYLLAALGAVMELPKVKIKTHKGQTTATLCTMPLSMQALADTLDLRHSRYVSTAAMLHPEGNPGSLVLEDAGADLPAEVNIPEIRVFRGKVAPGRTIDDIAGASGLTRAEAVHLAWLLVSTGVVSVLGHGTAGVDPHQWTVPEEFGSRALEPMPERKPVAAPVAAPAPVAAAEPAFDEQSTIADVPVQPTAVEPVAAHAVAAQAAPAQAVATEQIAPAAPVAETAAPVMTEPAMSSVAEAPSVASAVSDLKRELINAQQAQNNATALVSELNARLERLEESLLQHAS
ncbi:MAG: hypothetical protein VW906_09050 [Actinomycetota bacterium]